MVWCSYSTIFFAFVKEQEVLTVTPDQKNYVKSCGSGEEVLLLNQLSIAFALLSLPKRNSEHEIFLRNISSQVPKTKQNAQHLSWTIRWERASLLISVVILLAGLTAMC